MSDMLTIKEASKILNRGYLQTRIYLGDPDDYIVTPNGRQKFLYTPDHVARVKVRIDMAYMEKQRNKGKRKCDYCGAALSKEGLTSGICAPCRAYKLVKNFVYHGDCLCGAFDEERLNYIISSISKLKTTVIPH